MGLQIYVNGKLEQFEKDITLSELLTQKKLRPEVLTVEINDDILKPEDYETKVLASGDRVEIIFFMGGGASKKEGAEITESVLDLICNTPILHLHRLIPPNFSEVFAKLEMYSPGGSVKDRIAANMIAAAEKAGKINENTVIVEPTSGNTGIGISLVCAVKGIKCILVMPESMGEERVYILKGYGAEVILTPAREGMSGAISLAKGIISADKNAIILQQFENPSNPDMHYKTTGPEIYAALSGKIDAFVSGIGTGGTISGVAKYLKQRIPDVLIVGVEPAGSAVLSGDNPGPHRIQGLGAGFVPKTLDRKVVDEIVRVSDKKAFEMVQKLAKSEGVMAGISSGAALAASIEIAKRLGKNKNVVTVFPDTGERYFSLYRTFR